MSSVASLVDRTRHFLHEGRALEVRERQIMTVFQIWIYEGGRPLDLHSTVRQIDISAGLARGVDLLRRAMADAVADVLQDRFPLVRASSQTAAE